MSNNISSAVVLAGGFGTRLQQVVNDVPKPMATVAGKPFLFWVMQYLQKQHINHVVLSVGYKHQTIIDYFGYKFNDITINYAVEETPLGTGGGILLASRFLNHNNFFVVNGDTFFNVPLKSFATFHDEKNSDLSLALKPMKDFDRYGIVAMNEENKITGFEEKKKSIEGNINGGIYVTSKSFLDSLNLPEKFSFEKEVLEKYVTEKNIFGFVCDEYFIDIGIPEDYQKAQTDVELQSY